MRVRPDMRDAFLRCDLLHAPFLDFLDDRAFRCLLMVAKWSASARVWTYSPPDSEGWVKVDEKCCRTLLRVSWRTWKQKVLPEIERHLDVRKNGWVRLKTEYIAVGTINLRFPIAPFIREQVFARDGAACVYCGSTDKLQIDHRIPVSRGGTNEPDNLCVACGTCNLGKHARTELEWRQ